MKLWKVAPVGVLVLAGVFYWLFSRQGAPLTTVAVAARRGRAGGWHIARW
ncbi:MAG TPA: hypothetical protein VK364_09010 [Hymenobacter sp.]|nr:hypothetical protein [Hymenobacter sp.]